MMMCCRQDFLNALDVVIRSTFAAGLLIRVADSRFRVGYRRWCRLRKLRRCCHDYAGPWRQWCV